MADERRHIPKKGVPRMQTKPPVRGLDNGARGGATNDSPPDPALPAPPRAPTRPVQDLASLRPLGQPRVPLVYHGKAVKNVSEYLQQQQQQRRIRVTESIVIDSDSDEIEPMEEEEEEEDEETKTAEDVFQVLTALSKSQDDEKRLAREEVPDMKDDDIEFTPVPAPMWSPPRTPAPSRQSAAVEMVEVVEIIGDDDEEFDDAEAIEQTVTTQREYFKKMADPNKTRAVIVIDEEPEESGAPRRTGHVPLVNVRTSVITDESEVNVVDLDQDNYDDAAPDAPRPRLQLEGVPSDMALLLRGLHEEFYTALHRGDFVPPATSFADHTELDLDQDQDAKPITGPAALREINHQLIKWYKQARQRVEDEQKRSDKPRESYLVFCPPPVETRSSFLVDCLVPHITRHSGGMHRAKVLSYEILERYDDAFRVYETLHVHLVSLGHAKQLPYHHFVIDIEKILAWLPVLQDANSAIMSRLPRYHPFDYASDGPRVVALLPFVPDTDERHNLQTYADDVDYAEQLERLGYFPGEVGQGLRDGLVLLYRIKYVFTAYLGLHLRLLMEVGLLSQTETIDKGIVMFEFLRKFAYTDFDARQDGEVNKDAANWMEWAGNLTTDVGSALYYDAAAEQDIKQEDSYYNAHPEIDERASGHVAGLARLAWYTRHAARRVGKKFHWSRLISAMRNTSDGTVLDQETALLEDHQVFLNLKHSVLPMSQEARRMLEELSDDEQVAREAGDSRHVWSNRLMQAVLELEQVYKRVAPDEVVLVDSSGYRPGIDENATESYFSAIIKNSNKSPTHPGYLTYQQFRRHGEPVRLMHTFLFPSITSNEQYYTYLLNDMLLTFYEARSPVAEAELMAQLAQGKSEEEKTEEEKRAESEVAKHRSLREVAVPLETKPGELVVDYYDVHMPHLLPFTRTDTLVVCSVPILRTDVAAYNTEHAAQSVDASRGVEIDEKEKTGVLEFGMGALKHLLRLIREYLIDSVRVHFSSVAPCVKLTNDLNPTATAIAVVKLMDVDLRRTPQRMQPCKRVVRALYKDPREATSLHTYFEHYGWRLERLRVSLGPTPPERSLRLGEQVRLAERPLRGDDDGHLTKIGTFARRVAVLYEPCDYHTPEFSLEVQTKELKEAWNFNKRKQGWIHAVNLPLMKFLLQPRDDVKVPDVERLSLYYNHHDTKGREEVLWSLLEWALLPDFNAHKKVSALTHENIYEYDRTGVMDRTRMPVTQTPASITRCPVCSRLLWYWQGLEFCAQRQVIYCGGTECELLGPTDLNLDRLFDLDVQHIQTVSPDELPDYVVALYPDCAETAPAYATWVAMRTKQRREFMQNVNINELHRKKRGMAMSMLLAQVSKAVTTYLELAIPLSAPTPEVPRLQDLLESLNLLADSQGWCTGSLPPAYAPVVKRFTALCGLAIETMDSSVPLDRTRATERDFRALYRVFSATLANEERVKEQEQLTVDLGRSDLSEEEQRTKAERIEELEQLINGDPTAFRDVDLLFEDRESKIFPDRATLASVETLEKAFIELLLACIEYIALAVMIVVTKHQKHRTEQLVKLVQDVWKSGYFTQLTEEAKQGEELVGVRTAAMESERDVRRVLSVRNHQLITSEASRVQATAHAMSRALLLIDDVKSAIQGNPSYEEEYQELSTVSTRIHQAVRPGATLQAMVSSPFALVLGVHGENLRQRIMATVTDGQFQLETGRVFAIEAAPISLAQLNALQHPREVDHAMIRVVPSGELHRQINQGRVDITRLSVAAVSGTIFANPSTLAAVDNMQMTAAGTTRHVPERVDLALRMARQFQRVEDTMQPWIRDQQRLLTGVDLDDPLQVQFVSSSVLRSYAGEVANVADTFLGGDIAFLAEQTIHLGATGASLPDVSNVLDTMLEAGGHKRSREHPPESKSAEKRQKQKDEIDYVVIDEDPSDLRALTFRTVLEDTTEEEKALETMEDIEEEKMVDETEDIGRAEELEADREAAREVGIEVIDTSTETLQRLHRRELGEDEEPETKGPSLRTPIVPLPYEANTEALRVGVHWLLTQAVKARPVAVYPDILRQCPHVRGNAVPMHPDDASFSSLDSRASYFYGDPEELVHRQQALAVPMSFLHWWENEREANHVHPDRFSCLKDDRYAPHAFDSQHHAKTYLKKTQGEVFDERRALFGTQLGYWVCPPHLYHVLEQCDATTGKLLPGKNVPLADKARVYRTSRHSYEFPTDLPVLGEDHDAEELNVDAFGAMLRVMLRTEDSLDMLRQRVASTNKEVMSVWREVRAYQNAEQRAIALEQTLEKTLAPLNQLIDDYLQQIFGEIVVWLVLRQFTSTSAGVLMRVLRTDERENNEPPNQEYERPAEALRHALNKDRVKQKWSELVYAGANHIGVATEYMRNMLFEREMQLDPIQYPRRGMAIVSRAHLALVRKRMTERGFPDNRAFKGLTWNGEVLRRIASTHNALVALEKNLKPLQQAREEYASSLLSMRLAELRIEAQLPRMRPVLPETFQQLRAPPRAERRDDDWNKEFWRFITHLKWQHADGAEVYGKTACQRHLLMGAVSQALNDPDYPMPYVSNEYKDAWPMSVQAAEAYLVDLHDHHPDALAGLLSGVAYQIDTRMRRFSRWWRSIGNNEAVGWRTWVLDRASHRVPSRQSSATKKRSVSVTPVRRPKSHKPVKKSRERSEMRRAHLAMCHRHHVEWSQEPIRT